MQASYLRIFGQHKLDLIFFFKRTQSWVGSGVVVNKLGGEYDQNTLGEILK